MTLCKIFLFLFILAGEPALAGTPDPARLLEQSHCPANVMREFLQGNHDMRQCLASETHLICLQAKKYPGITQNPQSKQAVTQALGISNRNALYIALAEKHKPQNLQDVPGAGKTLASGLYPLKGIQFLTFSKGDRAMSIASLPLPSSQQLSEIYQKPDFIHAYCQTLFPEAKEFYAQGQYQKALQKLKEMHDLKFADVDAYLLTMQAFIHEKEPQEAAKLGREILKDLSAKIDAPQAEQLGDLFMQLDMQPLALEAYEIASKRMM